ncbi:C4-dicarboxylate ABC transporter substrate-binding protein [Methylobacterium variabile]|jgi:TRAP transporter TAXI family solute receptor|uniref:C4-dicarboxylate ABC transporter substrate-binding protein n=1 Tax=Methylobacterium variabile TaxID=298794 RepID=A0A0J6SHD8_9HYPH|nr:TAXI family TRAP transporter solute-binding subunit [Methylobacterium variabile]KMO33127.1 C4-dicarboxylate ABC transporter substrate-binding protein [Methylobacterium variabile]
MPAFLHKRESFFLLAALVLGAVAGAVLYLSRPTTLRVAVGPRDRVESHLIQAYADALARAREDIRLEVVPCDDVRDSAAALQSGRADLAVVRPDVRLPENGLTLAVLHDEALVVAAPPDSGIQAFPDLAGKRLGLVAHHGADQPLVASLLAYYALTPVPADTAPTAPGSVAVVPLRASEVAAALAEHRIDAAAVIAAPSAKSAARVVQAVESASPGRGAVIVAIPDGEAIVQRLPELQSVTIAAGTFGGRPKRPDDDVKTVGASYRLMARASLSRDTAASVTQHLFELRSRLAAMSSTANLMKAPEFDSAAEATSARLPIHPGAVDYYEREQQTFLQRYEDWVYLVAFFGGGLGSAVAWLGQRLAREQRARIDAVLDRLLAILTEARATQDEAALTALAVEIDGLVIDVVRHARAHSTDIRTMSALILAVDAARAAVAECRRDGAPPRERVGRVLSLHPAGGA